MVKVDSMRIFRGGVVLQSVGIAIVVKVDSGVVIRSNITCHDVATGIMEEDSFVVLRGSITRHSVVV